MGTRTKARPSRAASRNRPASRKVDALLEELKGVAGTLGFEVREEKLAREVGYRVRSGSCRVRDRDLLLLDRDLSPASRVEVLLDEISKRDLADVYLSPEVRRILGREEQPRG